MLAVFAEEDRTQAFSLNVAPLMRISLIQLSDRDYRFFWTFHHIVMEGWSAAIVLREVQELYTGYRQGEDPKLDPARPYSEYIRWLQRLDTSQAEAYWRKLLSGFAEPNHLPIDRARGDLPPECCIRSTYEAGFRRTRQGRSIALPKVTV